MDEYKQLGTGICIEWDEMHPFHKENTKICLDKLGHIFYYFLFYFCFVFLQISFFRFPFSLVRKWKCIWCIKILKIFKHKKEIHISVWLVQTPTIKTDFSVHTNIQSELLFWSLTLFKFISPHLKIKRVPATTFKPTMNLCTNSSISK